MHLGVEAIMKLRQRRACRETTSTGSNFCNARAREWFPTLPFDSRKYASANIDGGHFSFRDSRLRRAAIARRFLTTINALRRVPTQCASFHE
jgi:hypothetical protein